MATWKRCWRSTDEITKPKLKQNLIEHADMARLSRELVELVCDSPLPEPLEDLALKGIPPEPLKEFLEDRGSSRCSTASARTAARRAAEPGRSTSWRRGLRLGQAGGEGEDHRRPHANMRRWSPRRRSTAGSPRRGTRAMSRSIPRPTALDNIIARLVGISLATAAQQGLLHPDRPCRRRPVSPMRRSSFRPTWCWAS